MLSGAALARTYDPQSYPDAADVLDDYQRASLTGST